MSNQFFKFISDIINEYFRENKPLPGERFYLILNADKDTQKLKRSLEQQENVSPFKYLLGTGEYYITSQIEYKDAANLIIANTGEHVTNDFLVTLRNRVGDQLGEWEGKALISLITDDLDSISGGSISLQSEGMPLHPGELSKSIRKKVQEDVGKTTDRIILINYLTQIDEEREIHFTTFYDYKDVVEILYKGFLSSEDFRNLGMFKDDQIDTYKGASLQTRLKKNKELYSKLAYLNEFNQDDTEYEKLFLSKDVSQFKKDNWRGLDFKEVYNSYQESIKIRKKTKVEFIKIKFPLEQGCTYIFRPLSEKGAGQRKFQILIYTNELKNVSFSLEIDVTNSEKDGLQKEFLKPIEGDLDVRVRKRALDVSLNIQQNAPTFGRVVYKHEDKASLGAEFNICILPFSDHLFTDYHTSFEVVVKKGVKRLKLPFDSDEIKIGEKPVITKKITKENEILTVEDSAGFIFVVSEDIVELEKILHHVHYKNTDIEIELSGEKPEIIPIKANKLAKVIRESQSSFELSGNKITSHSKEYYIHSEYKEFLDLELAWLDEISYSGSYTGGQFLRDEKVELPVELKNAYNRFVNSFLKKPPSLTYWNDQIQDRAKDYVQEFITVIRNFDEMKPGGQKGRSLFKLGSIYNNSGDAIWLTPFHPLNVAFELRKLTDLEDEEIDQGILDRIKPEGLFPYIYNGRDEVLNPDSQQSIPGWVLYKKIDNANVADADLYLDKVVRDKLIQFEDHFSYLFLSQSVAPIKVNIINILNDYQAIRGLFKWYIEKKNKSKNINMPQVIVNVYRDHLDDSWCEHFAGINNVEDFETEFNVKLTTTHPNQSPQDLFDELNRNMKFYIRPYSIELEYAHISFYKMEAKKQFASQPMNQIESGISMNGLYNTVASKKFDEDYRSGFGVQDYQIPESDILLETAYYSNELAANMVNQASNTYLKDVGIVGITTLEDLNTIRNILDTSNWVTFVDPGVDLEFFESTIEDLLVIHYNDQYSSSSRYDAITVTSRSNQYFEVIKEFFDSLNISSDQGSKTVERTISAFNTINGEWLLKILGNRGYFTEEKLSIIAAIKASLAYFNHERILWVPVSLEEVLRVAGAANLSRMNGVFTAKNLGVSGKYSDDVLLIGLEINEGLKVHLYPIEVKVGHNETSIINKAKQQIAKTSALLLRETIEKDNTFKKKFYQNFFIQLFVSNANRMSQTNFFNSKDYFLSDDVKELMKKADYEFVSYLDEYIGKGAIFSFKKSSYVRSNNLEDGILIIEMQRDDDLKSCIVQEIEELECWFTGEQTEFVKERIPKYTYDSDVSVKQRIIDMLTE